MKLLNKYKEQYNDLIFARVLEKTDKYNEQIDKLKHKILFMSTDITSDCKFNDIDKNEGKVWCKKCKISVFPVISRSNLKFTDDKIYNNIQCKHSTKNKNHFINCFSCNIPEGLVNCNNNLLFYNNKYYCSNLDCKYYMKK